MADSPFAAIKQALGGEDRQSVIPGIGSLGPVLGGANSPFAMIRRLTTAQQIPLKPNQQDEEIDMTPAGLRRLADDEGIELSVYKDTKGIDTIGVGFNLEEPANQELFKKVTGFSTDEARAGKAITREQAHKLLDHTVAVAQEDAQSLVKNWDKLSPEQQDAITNFVFNVGKSTAMKFKDTFAAINRGDGPAAAQGLRRSLYAKQVGKRAQRVADIVATIQPEPPVETKKPRH